MSSRIAFLVKILAMTLLLFGSYYLFFLKPKFEYIRQVASAEKIISKHYFNLLENRLAYVELTKLDPNSPRIQDEKSDLFSTVRETNKGGLEMVEEENNIPDVDTKLTGEFPNMLSRTKEVFERQNEILNELVSKKTYEEGVELIKGQQSVELLTLQTNLILEFEYYLTRLRELR